MKSLKKERTAFTNAGATLRLNRNEETAANFDWLLVQMASSAVRNDRLNYLAHEMIKHGHYAKPASYDRNNPRSYESIRHGIMSHMFREWLRRNPDNAKGGKKTPRYERWPVFSKSYSYDAENSVFI